MELADKILSQINSDNIRTLAITILKRDCQSQRFALSCVLLLLKL
jgi:hypothetical protein